MLSIIICSRRQTDFESISSNIALTIGVPYEVIRIDNSTNQFGICQAYNKGAEQSKFEYLCFVHEDVLFITENWGKALLDLFTDPSIGLVGVAGGKYKSRHIGLAYNASSSHSQRINILQHENGIPVQHYLNPDNARKEEVVSIDGVFMVCPASVWKQNRFDEEVLKGFHFYDMDFSLQIGTSKAVVVTYDILLEHFSKGTLDKRWYTEALLAHKKWQKQLPRTTIPLNRTETMELEYENASFLFFFMVNNNFPVNQKLGQFWAILLLKPFKKYNLNLFMLALRG